MRVLVMTKIFPNAAEPLSAPFNRQQIAALGRRCEVEVLAPIPWFPGASLFSRWSSAGRLGTVPRHERIDGLEVAHPRTPYLPRFGHALSAALYGAALYPVVRARRDRFDVLLGTWAYPDGVAAVALGRAMRLPTVVKLHGSDVNVIGREPGPRWMIPITTLIGTPTVTAPARSRAIAFCGMGVSAGSSAALLSTVVMGLSVSAYPGS